MTKKRSITADALNLAIHPTVLAIRSTLRDGSKNVTTIYKNCNIEQSIASHFLRKLRQHNLVQNERKGKEILYTLNKDIWDILDNIPLQYDGLFVKANIPLVGLMV